MSVVFEWNGDQVGEGSGVGGMVDESPAGHDGDVIGTSAISDGPVSTKKRKVVNASGAANQFHIPHHADFDLGSNSLSIEAWVKRDANYNSSGYQYIIRKREAGPGYGFYMTPTFQLVVFLRDAAINKVFTTADDMIVANERTYLGLTMNPTTQDVHIYKNGVEESTIITGSPAGPFGNTDLTRIFSGSATIHGWNGWLEALRISTNILTAKHFYDTYHGSNIVEVN